MNIFIIACIACVVVGLILAFIGIKSDGAFMSLVGYFGITLAGIAVLVLMYITKIWLWSVFFH